MSSKLQDVGLWVALGFFGACAVYTANVQLRSVRNASQITQKKLVDPEVINQQTEDALKLDTLRELAFGSNYEIRNAAKKIILERVTQSPAYQLLLQNIAGKDENLRRQGLVSLKFLIGTRIDLEALPPLPTAKALIDCLCNITNSKDSVLPDAPTTLSDRGPSEKHALFCVFYLIRHNIRELLQAGLVSRWLANYPFGGSDSSIAQKKEIVASLRSGSSEDEEMERIFMILFNDAEARRQMRKCGLYSSAINETPDDKEERITVCETCATVHTQRRGARIHEESAEEHALRRRRREAMVLSEGGGPINNDDIIPGRDHENY